MRDHQLLEVQVPENRIELRRQTLPHFLLTGYHERLFIEVLKLHLVYLLSCLDTLIKVHVEDRLEEVDLVSEVLL
jgi:hypothetical protein